METILGALTGGMLVLSGLALGNLHGRRMRKSPDVVKPICDCSHSKVFHDTNGVCQKQIEYACVDSYGDVEARFRTCECQSYVGPEPLPGYYAPELGG